MAWYEHFDVQKHAVHKDDPKSKIMILTQHKKEEETRIASFKLKWAKFEVIDVTHLDYQNLMDIIFWNEQFGSPTNLILNFENSDLDCQQKLYELYEVLQHGSYVQINKENFKFIELREAWLSSQNGAYLMSSVPNSGDTWKDKVERLCTSNIIGRGQVYRILVLSGTHGSINPDGTISVSGFTRENLLDKDQYIDDLGYAKFLMKKMANDGFKLEIEVANMLDFCKPLGPKKDLCEFVHGKNPNMVVMAWCYSTNGKFYIYFFSTSRNSRISMKVKSKFK